MSWENTRKRTDNITVRKSVFGWMVSVACSDYNKKQRINRFLIRVRRKLKDKNDVFEAENKRKLKSIQDLQYKMFEDTLHD